MGRNARYRASEIKAGIWIFISLLILAAFIVGMSGARFWTEMDYYRVRLEYIGGLEVGSPVRLGGMMVGKVSHINLLPNGSELELTVEVRPGLPVKSNTVAYLSFVSITSAQHLELNPGAEPAPLLSSGDLIASREVIEMSDVLRKFDAASDSVQLILHQVSTLLRPANVARADSILIQANRLFSSAGPRIDEVFEHLSRATVSLDSVLGNVDRFVAGADTSFDGLMRDSRRLISQAGLALAHIDTTARDAGHLMNSNSDKLFEVLENLDQASRNLHLLTSTVRDNPFLLFRAIPRQERKLPR